jgi:hypothetical protein
MKRVKGTIEGDMCEVKDDDILSFNFPTRLDKGVKVSSTFYRNKKDSTWYLAGTWKTNKTKNYYPVTGKVDMKEEKDLSASKIFPHLEELNLANDVAFYKDRKKEKESSVVKNIEPENKKNEEAKTISLPSTEDIRVNPVLKKPEDILSITQAVDIDQSKETKKIPFSATQGLVKNNESREETTSLPNNKEEIKTTPIASTLNSAKVNDLKKQEDISQINEKGAAISRTETKQETERLKPVIKTGQPQIAKESNISSNIPDNKSIVKTTVPGISTSAKQTNAEIKNPATTTLPANKNVIASDDRVIEKKEIKNDAAVIAALKIANKPDLAIVNTAALLIRERKSEFSKVVNFKSDSLELALYDNGEIDGDTVSVLLNGEVIIAKQCLKASAFKKTIYITPGNDEEFTMVLYAENLGKYPPNTGLLVVHDGDDVYNVHFSADFQNNAGVIFRRKK